MQRAQLGRRHQLVTAPLARADIGECEPLGRRGPRGDAVRRAILDSPLGGVGLVWRSRGERQARSPHAAQRRERRGEREEGAAVAQHRRTRVSSPCPQR
eukprot:scaffold218220_cov32-Tisochrysis_lutea.AAC.1